MITTCARACGDVETGLSLYGGHHFKPRQSHSGEDKFKLFEGNAKKLYPHAFAHDHHGYRPG